MKMEDISKHFKVNRGGKDRNDIFWSFGKIHGLENIAFADPAELEETGGNPVKIQALANKYDGAQASAHSFDHLLHLQD